MDSEPATSAVMTRQQNLLAPILKRPVTIDVTIPWEEFESAPLQMSIDLTRCSKWEDVAAIQQLQALAELEDEPAKVGAVVDFVFSLVTDARGVPGFDSRGAGEPLESFRARFRDYFVEAEAEMMLVGVFGEYVSKELTPLASRRASFRP